MPFQGRGMPTSAPGSGGRARATLRVKFWPEPFEIGTSASPATPDFNAARAGMCARPKRALVIHTLWEVSYFAQFHTGTKRS